MNNLKYPDNESLKNAHLDFRDNMSEGYEHYPMIFSRLFNILVEIPKKAYVLDMGCNSGEISRMLKNFNNCKVQGIDISKNCISIARKKGINAIVGDIEKLPFKDNTFDCVFVGEVIEHSHKPMNILKEAYRVLKPGGKILGTTIYEEAMGVTWSDDRLHARTYNLESMKNLISKCFYKSYVWLNEYPDWTTIMFRGFKKGDKK